MFAVKSHAEEHLKSISENIPCLSKTIGLCRIMTFVTVKEILFINFYCIYVGMDVSTAYVHAPCARLVPLEATKGC